MDFTIADGGMVAVAAVSGFLAYARGFVRELLAIGGWFAAAALAFVLTPHIDPLVREIPVLGAFLAGSCVLSAIAAFTLIVAAALLILSILTPIFADAVLNSAVGPLDRGLGFLFGVARGVVLIAVCYMAYEAVLAGAKGWTPLDNAGLRVALDRLTDAIEARLPDRMPPWLAERIDALTAPCADELRNAAPALPEAPAAGGASTDG